jgi:hypothetical protein
MKRAILLSLLAGCFNLSIAQADFEYNIELVPVALPGLPGLHSYAFAQHDGKWLIIGGRKDGLHARQPFSAFPQSENNTLMYVIDVKAKAFWTASVNALPVGLKEQLQSTNMNFYQDAGTLYIIGGYAYSAAASNHITFPYLTSIQVSALINAIVNGNQITPFFKQISDEVFAVAGGQLGKLGDEFYLTGGHRFDGLYNPVGNPTFAQAYTNQIRKFKIDNTGSTLSYSGYTALTDEVHLRRRDFNLIPQIFPDGTEGYTISAGVFQINADLPFLYPVDIRPSGYTPVTTFNQYLSNYHSAKAGLYDEQENKMHTIFFGGMSQYYYQGGTLIQDNLVPFVRTISLLTRFADGHLQEYQLPIEMPDLKGAGAEFIPNEDIPHYASGIIKIKGLTDDATLLGHIYGGILSPSVNPFANNMTSLTTADKTIYAVILNKELPVGVEKILGDNPYDIQVYPNPFVNEVVMNYNLPKETHIQYFIANTLGQIVKQGQISDQNPGNNHSVLTIHDAVPTQTFVLTVVFDKKYFVTKRIFRK